MLAQIKIGLAYRVDVCCRPGNVGIMKIACMKKVSISSIPILEKNLGIQSMLNFLIAFFCQIINSLFIIIDLLLLAPESIISESFSQILYCFPVVIDIIPGIFL